MSADHKAPEAVKQRFMRWVGHPAPMKPFQSHWCDVDAMAAHVVALEFCRANNIDKPLTL